MSPTDPRSGLYVSKLGSAPERGALNHAQSRSIPLLRREGGATV